MLAVNSAVHAHPEYRTLDKARTRNRKSRARGAGRYKTRLMWGVQGGGVGGMLEGDNGNGVSQF
jgi:hypothetical protein